MMDKTFTMWQDCKNLEIRSSLEDLTNRSDENGQLIDFSDESIGNWSQEEYAKTTKGILKQRMLDQSDWRGRLAHQPWDKHLTARYNRINNIGYSQYPAKSATTKVVVGDQAEIEFDGNLTEFTTASKMSSAYVHWTNDPTAPLKYGADGHASSTDFAPFDTAWPNYKKRGQGVIQDIYNARQNWQFPIKNKTADRNVLNHCSIGPQLFTVDGRDSIDPSFENNNACYKCIIEQFGPHGPPAPDVYNDCVMRGVDDGYSALEDYCLHYCAMPECEEECHVHHLDQELTKDEEKFDRNELEDRLNDRFNSVSSKESLRTFDGVHMDVADYMDSTMLPGYDFHTKKYYVTSVVYHGEDDFVKALESTTQCDMDYVWHASPPPPPADPFVASLVGAWKYLAIIPVVDMHVSPNVLGSGTFTINNIIKTSDSSYKVNNITAVGVGCHLQNEEAGHLEKAGPHLWTFSFHLQNKKCGGVEGNHWSYKYQAHIGDLEKLRQSDNDITEYKVINVANLFMTGSVVRVKSHFTQRPAGPLPFAAGTGFTEPSEMSGRMSGAYGATDMHLEGESAAFSLSKI